MNKVSLGKELKNLRKKNKLTQIEACDKLYMSRKKLISIEQGNTMPSFEDVYFMSKLYKYDISNLIIAYEKYSDFNIKNEIDIIESKLSDMEYDSLIENIEKLDKYKSINFFVEQYYYAVSGFYFMKSKSQNIDIAIDFLINMLKINNSDFDIYDYKKYSYSNLELRALIALADCLRFKGDVKIYEDICEFSFSQLYSINISYFIISIQYATMKSMQKDYKTSIQIVDKCVEDANNINNHSYLPYLYYLNFINYKKINNISQANLYLEKALFLCDCLNKTNLKNLILSKSA